MKIYRKVVRKELSATKCDRCGVYAENGDPADSEFLRFSEVGGYASPFGDGTSVEIDLCADCVNKVLGQWLRRYGATPTADEVQK